MPPPGLNPWALEGQAPSCSPRYGAHRLGAQAGRIRSEPDSDARAGGESLFYSPAVQGRGLMQEV
jgi:hypothetical protein